MNSSSTQPDLQLNMLEGQSSHTGDKAGFMVGPLLYAAPSITARARALHTPLHSIAMMQNFCLLIHHYNRNNQSTASEIGIEKQFLHARALVDLSIRKTNPAVSVL